MDLRIAVAYLRKCYEHHWLFTEEGFWAFAEQVKKGLRTAPAYGWKE